MFYFILYLFHFGRNYSQVRSRSFKKLFTRHLQDAWAKTSDIVVIKIMISVPGVEIWIAFLICYLQLLYEIEMGHYFCPEFAGLTKTFWLMGENYVNKHSNGYMMHEDGNNFCKLWMTTAGNLRVAIRYEKLKVNFIYCFSHGIFQNQVYNFFVLFRSAVLS